MTNSQLMSSYTAYTTAAEVEVSAEVDADQMAITTITVSSVTCTQSIIATLGVMC